jgi:hypothetical protein
MKKSLYKGFYIYIDIFIRNFFFLKKYLYRGAFMHKNICTQEFFTDTGSFIQRTLYIEEIFIFRRFVDYIKKSLF